MKVPKIFTKHKWKPEQMFYLNQTYQFIHFKQPKHLTQTKILDGNNSMTKGHSQTASNSIYRIVKIK